MKFCHVTLAVKDLEASLRFYQIIIGLPVKRRFSGGHGTEIVFLGDGETEVELISGQSHDVLAGKGISLGFVTPSIENTIALLLENGYKADGSIIQPNPSIRFFFVYDPDGYRIQFVQEQEVRT